MPGSVHGGTNLRRTVGVSDSREDDERARQPHLTALHQDGRRQQPHW